MIGIYHDKDLDGLASAAILNIKFPSIRLIGWDYTYDHSELIKKIPDGKTVIMADLSLPANFMRIIKGKCNGKFWWFDHHVSAMEDTGIAALDLPGIRNSEVAACEILWGYYYQNQVINGLINLFGIYDTWRKDEADWEYSVLPVQTYFRTEMSLHDCQGDFIASLSETIECWGLNAQGVAILEGFAMMQYQEAQLKAIARSGQIREFEGHTAFVLNTTADPSRLAEIVWEMYAQAEITVTYKHQPGNLFPWKYSMRGRGVIDLSEIAKKHGGGGHFNAAGFSTAQIL